MKILIAPDKFKGSMSALVAAQAIAEGWHEAWPECELSLAAIADGGEGFAEILADALHAEWVTVTVRDPLGRPVEARYAWAADSRAAILEMSEASGLWRLSAEERAPLRAHTYGTGELMRHAIQRGARVVLVGLGGSATTDGGTGMAAALGYQFLDDHEHPLSPRPSALKDLVRIDRSQALALPEIIGACDVTNPLLGPNGTAAIFAPQKGAAPSTVEILERNLQHLTAITARDLQQNFTETQGAGAAGGFGYGLLSYCGATLRSGFEIISEALQLPERIRAADLVITGEGRLDGQSLQGKGPGGVAELARAAGKPVLGLAGSVEESPALQTLFTATLPVIDRPTTVEEAMAQGPEYLRRAAARAARLVRLYRARA